MTCLTETHAQVEGGSSAPRPPQFNISIFFHLGQMIVKQRGRGSSS